MALRSLVPVAAGAVAAAVMYGSHTVVLGPISRLLYPPAFSVSAAVLAVALSAAVAAATAPRLTTGLTGWLRHLPASGVAHRRALTAGLVVAQAPVLLLLLAGGLMTIYHSPATTLPRLVGLVPMAWCSVLGALPLRRHARVLAMAASVAAWLGSWGFLAVAALLLVIADRHAGPITTAKRRLLIKRRREGPVAGQLAVNRPPSPIRLWAVIGWRALRWRLFASWVAAPCVLIPAWLFLHNNRLEPAHELGAVRLAGVSTGVVVMAMLAEGLVKRRPPWPWIRSLPWSAWFRVAADGTLLAVVALPVMVLAAGMAPSTLPAVVATLPLLALRGSAAIREGAGRSAGASGPLLLEGLLVAGAVALVPWLAAAMLVLAPVAARLAIDRERRQPVSRWHELHHLAAGDPLSWSGT